MGQERQQLKWLAYTVAVTFAAVLGSAASLYVGKDSTGDAPFLLVLTWVVAIAGVVYELGAAIYQSLPGADDGQVSQALLAPVLERVQEPRIQTRQASQVLKASISSVFCLLWRR